MFGGVAPPAAQLLSVAPPPELPVVSLPQINGCVYNGRGEGRLLVQEIKRDTDDALKYENKVSHSHERI